MFFLLLAGFASFCYLLYLIFKSTMGIHTVFALKRKYVIRDVKAREQFVWRSLLQNGFTQLIV